MIDISKDSNEANHGIVGIGPGPYGAQDIGSFPTEGYDGTLVVWQENTDKAKPGGRTQQEWIELADAMIARWTEFRNSFRESK